MRAAMANRAAWVVVIAATGAPAGADAGPSPPQMLYAIGNGIGDGSSNLYRIDLYATVPVAVNVGETDHVFLDLAIDRATGFGWSVAGGQLYRIDLATASAITIGPTGIGTMSALECLANGTLLAWGQVDGTLYEINTSTGAATPRFSIGLTPGGDLAVAADGILYGSTGSMLIRINLQEETVTPIGPFGVSSMFGLDMDTNGDLYGARGSTGNGSCTLYRIDLETGAASEIAPVADVTPYGCFGLAFRRMPLMGDIEQDGDVDAIDLALILSSWGPCPIEGPCPADLNGDGVVNIEDVIEFLANWG
ncbi:MAG: hypothetical protein KDA25_12150 [Phycisphaerales bacterium]|nr:hypothetical protein [Phycisphaerales bacterium]